MNHSNFYIHNCNLSIISTGEIAATLIDMKDLLYKISPDSLSYHFWGKKLHSPFIPSEYYNDFAKWAHFELHDDVLAERLAMINPLTYIDIQDLRNKVINVVEARIAELGQSSSTEEHKFHFLRSNLIIYTTSKVARTPADLKVLIQKLPQSSIFYHIIDAKTRNKNGLDDFSCWLSSWNSEFQPLIERLKDIDGYFLSLNEIQNKFTALFRENL